MTKPTRDKERSRSLRSDIIRMLLQSHINRDDDGFRKAALQLAATESAAGHTRVAEDLRSIVAEMEPSLPRGRVDGVVDIAQPRGSLASILDGGHREERLRDIVLPEATRTQLLRVLEENSARSDLEKWGVQPRRRLLFHGPPGCGKTLSAAVLAGEMRLPLMTVQLDALFSRYLGETATHLRSIFGEMPRRPGVYLFDEFDAVAKARGDSQDVGEMNRIVTSFLQLLDADRSGSILIAATNHYELLDRAVFRRFELVLPFHKPTDAQIEELVRLRLAAFPLGELDIRRAAARASGMSFADVAAACENGIRTMALDGRTTVSTEDLLQGVADICQQREAIAEGS